MSNEKVIVTKSKLDALATRIANNAGISTPLTIDQMMLAVDQDKTEINVIRTQDSHGGTILNIDISVVANHFANGDTPIGEISTTAASLPDRILQNRTKVTKVSGSNVTTLGANAFNGCTNLKSVYLPNVTNMPYSCFYNCTSLVGLVLPSLTGTGGGYFCRYDSNLEYIDIIGNAFNTQEFQNCSKLTTMVLRRTSSPVQLWNGSALSGVPMSGISGVYSGHIYVPSSLIETYKTATNWSTIYANYPDVFVAIEGSEYENNYADGSPISTYGQEITTVNDDYFNMDKPFGRISTSLAMIPEGAYFGRTGIMSYEDSVATIISNGAFSSCSNLKQVTFPNVTEVRNGAFQRSGIESLYLPKLTTINSGYVFDSCSELKTIVLPSLTACNTDNLMSSCLKLTSVDIGANCPLSGGRFNTFQKDGALNTLILRRSIAPATLNNINNFNQTPFASGGTGGTIYIPKVLYDELGTGSSLDYKAATNWSTIDSYGTITWAQIEGSQYENYYVDGTPIP